MIINMKLRDLEVWECEKHIFEDLIMHFSKGGSSTFRPAELKSSLTVSTGWCAAGLSRRNAIRLECEIDSICHNTTIWLGAGFEKGHGAFEITFRGRLKGIK